MSNSETQPQRVLVLDADTLPALAIVRSLGKLGLHVQAASHTEKPITSYSRYAAESLQYPSPLTQEPDFLEWVSAQIASSSAPVMVVPATERTMVPLSRHFQSPGQRQFFAMPAHRALEQVLDKSQTSKLAQSCDIPQPRSWTLHKIEDLERLLPQLVFPLVVKPARSIPEGEQRQPLTVKYAHSAVGLRNIVNTMLKHTHLILQEYFRGEGVGVEVLARNGVVEYAFQHRRLHEVPLSGGGSSLRISEDIHPPLLKASKTLMAKLNWNGVAMVEFKQNPDSGEFILVEINGRFWGSLPLATAAGADFPRLLWALHHKLPLPELAQYKRALRCRKLSSDLHWLEAVLRQEGDTRLVPIPSRRQAIQETLGMLLPKERFDAQSFSDPLPGIVDIGRILANYRKRLSSALIDKRHQWRITRASNEKKVAQHLVNARRLLFVCYGNINRSAVAQALCEQLPNYNLRPECRSAGFHSEPGRPADDRMVALAAADNIKLDNSLSSVLTPELIEWADLVLVMECSQVQQVYSISSATPVVLLGGTKHARCRAREIPDPYNQSKEIYSAVYNQIKHCVESLLVTWNSSKSPVSKTSA
ncbi:ATP-grasp domain-containing protein [Parahaliea sp. F7430]|uniref:protein-tyrosine-phosphatase n=1 Tax=Sediminihaliea albiluteola TaxID=2758564 RepID=A0A7W2YIN1_9GAMM|nr:ATP-grasp domain-containing protein [Sediminihaliea albiluteola]MBA6412686.1 ATP-grasp domain-containing protein [Sediminihaliea albiluteola]